VGDEVRPTLAEKPWVFLGTERVAARGPRLTVHVPNPERLRGAPLRLTAGVLLPNVRLLDVKPRVVRRTRAEERLRLTLDTPPTRDKFPLYVIGLRVPDPIQTSERVTV